VSDVDVVEVAGFAVALDRAYDPAGHFWVSAFDDARRLRIGMDALGVETSGTLAQLAFLPLGAAVKRGEPFGSLEAAKFVGPLTSPVSGTVTAHNEAVLSDPSLVDRDPYGAGWLIEVEWAEPAELDGLVQGSEVIPDWFAAEVEQYRLKGMLAE
jgi:glycine cleavage system H protein